MKIALAIFSLFTLLQANLRAAERVITPEDRQWWAFQKVTRPSPPEVKDRHWVRNPIDAFILAALEAKQIQPSPAADKVTLLRRAYLDMIGLPPTPAEVDAFVADKSPRAFDKVVDKLLASPHYGERWARHWLDLARYAESEGFKGDETRPNAWRYRDYVIDAFNSDKPYNRFIAEQLAGDELWPNDPAARVATGFNRHYADESNARDLLQRRQDILNDMTDTTSGVFLGLTCACARCHDHKYDPILQSDYYRLQSFFAGTHARDNIILATPREVKEHDEKFARWEKATREIRSEMDTLEAPGRDEVTGELFHKYPTEVKAAIKKPLAERTPLERWYAFKADQYLNPDSHEYVAATSQISFKLKGDQKTRFKELQAELEKFAALRPPNLPIGIGIVDIGREAPKTSVLSRGVYDKPKTEVQPAFLTVINPSPAKIIPPKNLDSTGRRSALVKILTDPNNPLTARVMVNRIWAHHFGTGIVGTPSDFGTRGEPPTNPKLLDYLASEFVHHGWSIKYLHRLILTSTTYQQSSDLRQDSVKPAGGISTPIKRHSTETTTDNNSPSPGGPRSAERSSRLGKLTSGGLGKPLGRGEGEPFLNRTLAESSSVPASFVAKRVQDALAIDPDDKLLWHFPRQRLEGEIIRDSALAVSGLLNPKLGGPSVFPELPDGMPSPTGGWSVNEDRSARNRRSIYIFVRRNVRYPMFDAFDMPDPHESCPRRNVTTGPIQALTLLNSKLTLQWAQGLAARVIESAGSDPARQIDTAFRIAYGRSPDATELRSVETFVQNDRAILTERLAKGEKLALPSQLPTTADPVHAATLVDLCHTLLNTDAFVYRD